MRHHLYGTRLYVNLSHLEHNIQTINKSLKNCSIIAMVKANAYGHGDIVISRKLEEFGVNYFGVADFEEGVRLRVSGLKSRIMVMNPASYNMATILKNNLEPVIYNDTILLALHSAIKESSCDPSINQPISIHVKINTGMNRWGFDTSEIPKLIARIKNIKNIKVQSIYSHLSSSKNPQDDQFTKRQLQTLIDQKSAFMSAFNYNIDTHIYNSFGMIRFLSHNNIFNYARIGLALYGAINNINLKPIAELKCPIAQIRSVKKGDSIGYDRSYIAQNNMKIGIVPFGYADGLQRRWGNGVLNFFYKKKLIPTVGNISMDSCMVDISDIEGASETDTIIYFGKDRPIWDLAKELNTIPYEIMATLSKRIKRIYH